MKPSVVLLDTLDDRREILVSLLGNLLSQFGVSAVLEYAQWCCDFAMLTSHTARAMGSTLNPFYDSVMVEAARRGDTFAKSCLCNAIFLDMAELSHQTQTDFLVIITELENRAKGREHTPAAVAAEAYRNYQRVMKCKTSERTAE